MRITAKLEVYGNTLEESLDSLKVKWRGLMKDDLAELPLDAEMTIEDTDDSENKLYKVSYTARTRLDDEAR